ncbi:MAG TPA: hypothetical protein VHS08_01650 [Candidatus Acidoferrales bacterium]|nr:hypothetical protein [Candidatus Acidoferrales bacterium]
MASRDDFPRLIVRQEILQGEFFRATDSEQAVQEKIAESFRVGLQLASLLPSASKPYTYAPKNAACKDPG